MKAFVHYFSGTGNTAHAALLLLEELKKLGIDVSIRRVERCTEIPPQEFDCHIFMFPVYALTIPYTMQSYMKKFAGRSGTKAVVIANYGMVSTKGGWHTGYESQSLIQAARILRRRNFDVLIIEKVGYPVNLTVIANPPSEEDCKAIFETGDSKIKEIAKRIALQERYLKNYGIPDLIFGWLFGALFTYFGRWQFGKFYIADRSCNSCGICERICPANTIHFRGKRTVWGYKCDACLRCYNLCPQKSIQISLPRLMLFIALTIGLIPFITANYSIACDFVFGQLSGNSSVDFCRHGIAAVILGIISYFILFPCIFYILEKVIFLLEKIPVIRSVFEVAYTRNIQRYVAPEFKPMKNSILRFHNLIDPKGNVTNQDEMPHNVV